MTPAAALTALRHVVVRRQVTILYVIIVTLCVVGFHKQSERDARQCAEQQQTRETVRDVVSGVAELGRGLVQRAPDPKAAAKPFDDYERENLKNLPPIVCD